LTTAQPKNTFVVMADKFPGALKSLREALGVTQIVFAKKLGIGAPSVAHYETGSRRPGAATSVRFARTAHEAGRIDLAEIFAAALPGVQEGLLVPVWRLPKVEEPAPPQLVEKLVSVRILSAENRNRER
jgi:transcriptional regulator with XRE-family HTH domain